jgi:hypothetical protein
MGIDLTDKEYWIHGHGWKIAQLGKANKKLLSELFTRHDDLVVKHAELDPIKDAVERIKLSNEMVKAREEIEDVGIPLMLLEMNGKPFNEKKWFGDNTIPAAAWWDCATDVFLFLRESGSKDDTLLSMMRHNSA